MFSVPAYVNSKIELIDLNEFQLSAVYTLIREIRVSEHLFLFRWRAHLHDSSFMLQCKQTILLHHSIRW